MKKTLKVALYILLALVLIVLAYVIYVFAAYYRVEDWQTLSVVHCDAASAAPMEGAPQTGVTYRVSSANVGFGAYSADYSFFMDGGTSSWAESPETVQYAINGAGELVKSLDPDFALIQEIDLDATRSYHTDEYEMLRRIMIPPSCSIRLHSPTAAAGQDSDCSRNIRCLLLCAEASPSPLPSASSSIWTAATASPGSRWTMARSW